MLETPSDMPGHAPSRRGRHSTRLRIGLAFSMLALVLFFAVGLLSGTYARREVQQSAGAGLAQLATRTALTLDAGMFERYREIQNFATLERLTGERVDADRWRAVLDRLQASFHYYSWIGVANVEGTVLAATGRVLEGKDVSARPWFKRGIDGPFVGDVHPALLLAKALPPTGSNEPLRLVDFAAPIRRGNEVIAVIGAHLTWKWAEERCAEALRSVEPARRVEMLIVDSQGKQMLGSASASLAVLPGRPLESLVADGQSIDTWSDGQRYLTAAVRASGYQAYPGLGWTVLVRQPLDTALSSADALQQRIWAFGLVGALLFGVVGWWLAGWITAPLRKVAAQAHRLAADVSPSQRGIEARAGPESAGAESTGAERAWPQSAWQDDEVADLARSLNALVAQLQARQRELLVLNATLESRVEQRTESLSRANADLQGFSRSVAHDLKGPIGTIGAVIDNVVKDQVHALNDGSRRLLTMAARECERLCCLVDELMALAMVEQRPMKPAAVSMQALVDTVVTDLRTTTATDVAAAASRAQVIVAELPDIEGDEVLLRQVWQNLLANAFKFSARSVTPRIEVSAERSGTELVFSVRDNGAGFDMAQSDKLFVVFQRLHKSSDFAGTGVGLSIVKRVVHRHGGRVWARATPGQGAQFYFTLPL